MNKTSRKPPPRKSIKARGALPVPRTAPRRVRLAWHQRLGTRIVGAIVFALLVVLAVKVFQDKQDRDGRKKDDIRAIQQFERKSEALRSSMEPVFDAINQAPSEFQQGKLSAEAFKEQTEGWLTEFTKLDAGLRARKVPPRLKGLTEARAMLVDGTVVYIDSIKQFQLAASLPDPAVRDEVIKQGYNLFSHAHSVFSKGQRLIERERRRLGVVKEDPASPNPLLQPANLVELEAPPPQPPGPAPGVPPNG